MTVNNAGVGYEVDYEFLDSPMELHRNVLVVNTIGIIAVR